MKITLEVSDNKASFLLELLNNFSFVKMENSFNTDKEESEIKNAFKNASLIKQNKLKTRPVNELLNEL